jgi:hypothetical protein
MSWLSQDLGQGARAGALGAVAVASAAALRNKLLGRLPPYSSQLFVSHVAERAGWPLSPGRARVAGALLRLAYGSTIGLIFARVGGPSALRRPGVTGVVLGTTVLLLERLSFPRMGITPPARQWTRGERLLLMAQTTIYGLVVARTYRRSGRLPAP